MTDNIIIPGATVVSVEHDTVSFYKPDDTPIERMTVDVHGTQVEVIRYDHNDSHVLVAIGGPFGSMEIMPADEVAEYIAQNTE